MPKGGRRSTTWTPGWKSGKTTVIRIPEVLVEELLRVARVLDDGGTVMLMEGDSHVTGDTAEGNETALKEAADSFLMTIPPRDRRAMKKLLYKFIDSIGTS